jgi:hypothetical protein
MKRKVFGILFLLLFGVLIDAVAQRAEKGAFYRAMASGSLDEIDHELDVLKATSFNDKEGYEGAMLMRKAGLLKKAKEKLAVFKEGRIKLETALLNHSSSAELHFLRLSIEEHAPKVVKYRANIAEDKEIVLRSFKNLAPEVQHAIMEYSKTSKVLTEDEIKSAGHE